MEDTGQEDDHEMRRESAPSCHRSFRRRTRLFRNGPDGAVERIHGTKGDGSGGSLPGSVMNLSQAKFEFMTASVGNLKIMIFHKIFRMVSPLNFLGQWQKTTNVSKILIGVRVS